MKLDSLKEIPEVICSGEKIFEILKTYQLRQRFSNIIFKAGFPQADFSHIKRFFTPQQFWLVQVENIERDVRFHCKINHSQCIVSRTYVKNLILQRNYIFWIYSVQKVNIPTLLAGTIFRIFWLSFIYF